jgi:hypothetical protein
MHAHIHATYKSEQVFIIQYKINLHELKIQQF